MYEAHFGFTDKPFKLSPDPRFFFASPHHEKALSYLQYGLSLEEGFIVVSGPIGTGKTILVHRLMSSLDESVTAVQIATTRLSPDELVKLVAAKFNVPTEGMSKADILKRFEQHLYGLRQQGRRAVLLVDEAQNLPPETVEELRMLSNFQFHDKPLLQSFLLGQEELKGIIRLPEMEQLRQRIIASCHLQPLTADQVKSYMLHRLQCVNWRGNPTLSDGVFEAITRYTKGVPRKINILADRIFLYACMEGLTAINTVNVEHVIAEMSEELPGETPRSKTSANVDGDHPPIQPDPSRGYSAPYKNNLEADRQSETAHAFQALNDIEKVLDNVIERKIATIRKLDQLLINKRKMLLQSGEEGIDDELILNEDYPPGLREKYWVRKLMESSD
ncbi:XrtA/PEP-CTERM system-associated ATPase [Photobacterium sp. TLY01]|uniref:XrtA/PEP-CTERM system-associated ATPase n=1 Tax=Photobacterium sp. TLY01 TaxID=2907534 RepID=UPI001F34A92D|nr:XrtA/PEP-CTERM system-associated ATPase [Photobacterium sp. TLY01]UIP30104.1 XrtA-associated ATPase [Photobacterium sp. TLY01]